MKPFKSFVRRDDLCCKGQSRVLQAVDCGTILKHKTGWYATVDSRLHLIPGALGILQPTVGPYKTAYDAYEAFERASAKLEGKTQNGSS